MTTFFLCALLLSNVFMVGVLLAKPLQSPKKVKEEEKPEVSDDAIEEEDNDIVKIVKVAVKEAVPEVLKVMGRFCDADPADIEESDEAPNEHPAIVPNDKLDDVFSHSAVTASDLDKEEQEVIAPKAEGLDFESMQKTVNVLKGKSDSEDDLESIGHLARIHGKINHKNVFNCMDFFMDNAELSGRAEDAMSDIEMFVKK